MLHCAALDDQMHVPTMTGTPDTSIEMGISQHWFCKCEDLWCVRQYERESYQMF